MAAVVFATNHPMLIALRRVFLAGLLVLVPISITLWVLNGFIGVLDKSLLLLPYSWRPESLLGFDIPGLGSVLTIVIILITGLIARNFLGGQLLRISERLFARIPVVNSIYSSVKQVSDTLLSSSGKAFSKAVLIRYPHHNTWAIGFLTGAPDGSIALALERPHVSVFLPTTPNPTSGFFLLVPQDEIIELSISVDEALKYVVSMGVVPVKKT